MTVKDACLCYEKRSVGLWEASDRLPSSTRLISTSVEHRRQPKMRSLPLYHLRLMSHVRHSPMDAKTTQLYGCIQIYLHAAFSGIKDTLFGTSVCRCLIIRTQTYCIMLPELGKQLILQTLFQLDRSKSWISSHRRDPIDIVHVAR